MRFTIQKKLGWVILAGLVGSFVGVAHEAGAFPRFPLSAGHAPWSLPPLSRVVGGEVVGAPDRFSTSTVRLVILGEAEDRGVCTGSIMAEDWILTAAHCLEAGPLIVRIDFFGAQGLQEYRMADRYLVHAAWQSSATEVRSDVALVHFKGGLPAGNTPARLLGETLPLGAGPLPVTIAGYGLSDPEAPAPDDALRELGLEATGKVADCVELKPRALPGSGCSGDSGGPAFVERDGVAYLWGVASYVTEPYCRASTFYTEIADHAAWIEEARVRLLAAPEVPSPELSLLAERKFKSFLWKYRLHRGDAARVRALRKWLAGVPADRALSVANAMDVLLELKAEGPKLEAFLALAPRLRFESVRQAHTLLLFFEESEARARALAALGSLKTLGIGYLQGA